MGRPLAYILIALMLVSIVASCRTRYVPVNRVHIEERERLVHHRDSIYLHDSIIQQVKGDTVLVDRWRTKYVDRKTVDTLRVSVTDTVTVVVEVDRPPSLLHRIETSFWRGVGVLALLYLLIELIRKRLWRK